MKTLDTTVFRIVDRNWRIPRLTTLNRIIVGKIAVLAVATLVFSGTAMAQCAASFNAMASAAMSIQSQSKGSQSTVSIKSNQPGPGNDNSVNPSIVGFWHISFLVGDQQIQEAFQIWNTGGTEVHNPNVDPRGGSVCLGAWTQVAPQTYKLTHRVWLWSTDGVFQGIGNLSETLTLGDRGNSHSGSFELDIYDPLGNPVAQIPGNVVAERISPN